jgi:hypothetical protein
VLENPAHLGARGGDLGARRALSSRRRRPWRRRSHLG